MHVPQYFIGILLLSALAKIRYVSNSLLTYHPASLSWQTCQRLYNSVLRMRCAFTIDRSPMKLFLFHPTIVRTVRSLWTWLWGRYHVPQNVFLVLY